MSMTMLTKAPRPLTVGELLRQIKVLKIDKDATIKIPHKHGPYRRIDYLSYCRDLNQVSLW